VRDRCGCSSRHSLDPSFFAQAPSLAAKQRDDLSVQWILNSVPGYPPVSAHANISVRIEHPGTAPATLQTSQRADLEQPRKAFTGCPRISTAFLSVSTQCDIEVVHYRNHHGHCGKAIGHANPETDTQISSQKEFCNGVKRQKWQQQCSQCQCI